MGVNGLWKLLEPVGRPVTLESLENKTLAVDISVWLNQALYGMRNQHGNTIPNAHLVLLFQRICKLLFYRVKPIFVFDGGVPELKTKTTAARRETRLSARHSARKLSEKVFKKYIKSHAIGNVTGRTSQRPNDIVNEAEEHDLFELPPLPEEKAMKSSLDDESAFQVQHFQDIEGVNIDSDDFRKLPYEMQHEIIVEMREKNKRHSRYQTIDMPEETDEFSNFQLNHLLKRGKLTQRLETIRKGMNERRAGDLVVDVAYSGVGGNSIIQSEKIMSEETGHYILIKRSETSKPEDDEVEEDTLAGGFFRECHYNDADERPIAVTSLPLVSDKVAEASVSHALDENSSSTDVEESSVVHNFVDVTDLSVFSPTGEDNTDTPKDYELSVQSVLSSVSMEESMENISEKAIDNKHDNVQAVGDDKNLNDLPLEEKNSDISVVHLDIFQNNTPGVVKDITPQDDQTINITPQTINVDETDAELDEIEDEIKLKKMLIEKLLCNRGNSKIGETIVVDSEVFVSENLEQSCSLESQEDVTMADDTEVGSASVTGVVDNDEGKSDETPSFCTTESTDENATVAKEFAGATYEDLEEIQAKLDEDLDNLNEERSRQNRLAATVSDEMYKDSQELLQLFGIPFVVSPMEAEAQCATLNTTNLCDGSITEDSDIMLFGGKKVYKNIFNHNKNAELYQEDDVKCVLGLHRQDLITIALLTGSDYTEGVQGIGVVSAMEIIQEFSGEGIDKLKNLKNWLNETKEHGSSSHQSKLKSKLRHITLPTGFPSEQVFEAYLNPVVDDSSEAFSWANPDLHSLRLYAAEKLGWSKTRTDEILLPVLKRLNSSETQSKIDAFFPVQFNKRKIKSLRVKRVVNRLLNKDPDDKDCDEKKRKTNLNRRKRKKPQLSKIQNMSSEDESFDRVQQQSTPSLVSKDSVIKATAHTNNQPLSSLQKDSGNNTRTDSTSDTSDDDKSYVPFKKVTVQPRGRAGCRAATRGSRSRAKKTSTTKTKT